MELGARLDATGVDFAVWSRQASAVSLCLFDEKGEHRLAMAGDGEVWRLRIEGLGPGARYGLRADGPWHPERGLCFDPAKLLVDPWAAAIDRPFAWHPALSLPRPEATDTADLVPKALVTARPQAVPVRPPRAVDGGLILEANVRALTLRHPELAPGERGTLRGLAHPAILGHFRRLGVAAVELMPIAAWIDERHLPALGLSNAWGYNPVLFSALDPRLAPGGMADLRHAVAALHDSGIAVLVDVVFNHSGESDRHGATLSLRGLGEADFYRLNDVGELVNDTGCGNTLACDRPQVIALALAALRRLVTDAGVDGFRFDLAPILGRTADGFSANATLLAAIAGDRVLADRVLIAEPWDLGPGGYRLGQFGAAFLEWNDRARDDIRRFWRGDGTPGALATRLAGSSDLFRHGAATHTRSVNFVAAHDGFTLTDLVSYRHRHNAANGEGNRDGHADNHSWNNGVEGPSDDPAIVAARAADRRALLATLFACRGTPMITAGDEFGRSQNGNNNAYAQANDTVWLDWAGRDHAFEDWVAALSAFRAGHKALAATAFLDGTGDPVPDVLWFTPDGKPMMPADWEDPAMAAFGAALLRDDDRVAAVFNRARAAVAVTLPPARPGRRWRPSFGAGADFAVAARSVGFFVESA